MSTCIKQSANSVTNLRLTKNQLLSRQSELSGQNGAGFQHVAEPAEEEPNLEAGAATRRRTTRNVRD